MDINPIPYPLLSARLAARMLDTTVAYLAQMRYEKRGPRYIKLGKDVRYDRRELDRYSQTQADRTYLTTDELANWLGVSISKIYELRASGLGPASIKQSRTVLYRKGDVDQFLLTLERSPEVD